MVPSPPIRASFLKPVADIGGECVAGKNPSELTTWHGFSCWNVNTSITHFALQYYATPCQSAPTKCA
ncbi:hypothetical protein GOP47_0031135, partial [Adiantum capillus-veneris]